MGSLSILVAVTLACYGVIALVLAWVARKVGSSRGKFRFGLLALLAVVFLVLGCVAIAMVLPHDFSARLPILLCLLLIELVAPPFILKRIFRLKMKRALVVYLVLVALMAIQSLPTYAVKGYLVEAFEIPTATMSPTIEPTHRFLANKLLQPRRWDLVVYWNESVDGRREPFCRRLIGLPGERLRFENGNLYVNDQLAQPPPVLEGKLHASGNGFKSGPWKYADGETISLGANEFFVVGDNIAVSADSRVNGPSDRSALIGVVDVTYWPLSRFKLLR